MDVGCSKRCLISAQFNLAIGMVTTRPQQIIHAISMSGAMMHIIASQKQAWPRQSTAAPSFATPIEPEEEADIGRVAPYAF